MSLLDDQENDEVASDSLQIYNQPPPETATTLLPSPIAGAISLVARSSSLYLRIGTFIGSLALDGARVTTLTGLELSRAIIEGILTRAGNDVAVRASGEIGKSDAEGLLERSIGTLHSTITSISFAVSTGFHLSSATLSTSSDLSQHLLAALDSILGSTDSSRAIASIVTLIRREFQNPATGQEGEKVGVVDLLLGLCGLALLQKWSSRMIMLEAKEKDYEQIVWDVVILDDGRRADVLGDSSPRRDDSSGQARPVSFLTMAGDEEILKTIQRQNANVGDENEDWPEAGLKEHIMEGLPPNAGVSITTSTTTTKTITIEVTGAEPSHISPPPGVELLEENFEPLNQAELESAELDSEQNVGFPIPRYRVVYRAIRNSTRGTDIQAGSEEKTQQGALEDLEDSAGNSKVVELPSSTETLISEGQVPTSEAQSARLTALSNLERRGLDVGKPVTNSPTNYIAKPAGTLGSMSSDVDSPSRANSANQKRPRKPMSSASNNSVDNPPPKRTPSVKAPLPRKSKAENAVKKPEDPQIKKLERRGTLRNALKRGSGTSLSSLWNKELPFPPDAQSATEAKGSNQKPAWVGSNTINRSTQSSLPVSIGRQSPIPAREAPRAPPRGNPNYFSSRDLGIKPEATRSPSRASFYSIHERRRDSMISQTDTYSIHSGEPNRPESPATLRTNSRAQLMGRNSPIAAVPPSPQKAHRRNRSYAPSIYTINGNSSATSLVLASPPSRSAFQNSMSIQTLARNGFVDGMFPRGHLVSNISRFVRFASASYGSHFLRIMGIAASEAQKPQSPNTSHHQEHHSFSNHTKLPADTILISSFADPQGGTDATGETNTGVPMVHFVSLDHESRAVVLTCRGTLGFEDVLTDMTCDYDELVWRGQAYKVHKGIHASARRLLEGGGGKVLATIKFALEEFPDYGLVLTGHSLGGGVVAILAIMISEPLDGSTSFVTSSAYQKPQLQLSSTEFTGRNFHSRPIGLPPGRPIHVYAYGPPSTISPSLRKATRNLITTIVNGQDLVPFLSLGTLHDLQAVALAFKTDDSDAKAELRRRLWSGLSSGFTDRWYGDRAGKAFAEEEDQWAYATLKTLRATMLSSKLVPPGEVFLVETQPVLQRHAYSATGEHSGLGRPATRATMRYVRDVETRFGELRFGGSMLLDHSPGRYEASLSALGKGVLV